MIAYVTPFSDDLKEAARKYKATTAGNSGIGPAQERWSADYDYREGAEWGRAWQAERNRGQMERYEQRIAELEAEREDS